MNSLCQFPLYPSAAVQGSDGENGTEVHAGKREGGSVKHTGGAGRERDGLGKAFSRGIWSRCCGGEEQAG